MVTELRVLLARGRLCCLHALHVFGKGADYSCHTIEGADIDVPIGQSTKRRSKTIKIKLIKFTLKTTRI